MIRFGLCFWPYCVRDFVSSRCYTPTPRMPVCPLLVILILIIWFRYCVVFSLYSLLLFVTNENFVGRFRFTVWKSFPLFPIYSFIIHMGCGFLFIKCVVTCYYHYFDVQMNSDLVSRIPLKLTPVSFQYALVRFGSTSLPSGSRSL